MNRRKNMEIHQGTGKISLNLFQKEKDLLKPLPSQALRDQYRIGILSSKVNASNMVTYRSNQYSVPPEYQGKRLTLEIDSENLYVYDNTKLVTIHPLSAQKLNYHADHYIDNLNAIFANHDAQDIQEFARKNLVKIGTMYSATKK